MLETLGLDIETTNAKLIRDEEKSLAKYGHEEPASGDFNYSIVVGMLLYLAGQTHPDITYPDYCSARYMFSPKLVHKLTLEQIGGYLKATSDKGLIVKPSRHSS